MKGYLKNIFEVYEELKYYWLLKKSNLFDVKYYLLTYPEVRAADVDPLWHFIKNGSKENRSIAPWYRNLKFYTPPFLSNSSKKDIHPLLLFLNKNDKKIYRNLNDIERGQRLKENFIYNFCWIGKNEPDNSKLKEQENIDLKKLPLITIILYLNGNTKNTRDTLSSIICQTYKNWELIIFSSKLSNTIKKFLTKKPNLNSRVKIITKNRRDNFTTVLNNIVNSINGEYIAFVKDKDTLAPFALFEIVNTINKDEDGELIYSDEDIISSKDNNLRYNPFFKPDWSPDTLRSFNYIKNLMVIKKNLLEEIGYFKLDGEEIDEYDLVLRATEKAKKIIHINKILYHTRDVNVFYLQSDNYKIEREIKALSQHLQRIGVEGSVKKGLFNFSYKVEYKIDKNPLVSIIIPNKDNGDILKRCIFSLLSSTYQNIEIIIVENFSQEKETFLLYEELKKKDERIKVIEWKAPTFNYSLVNNYAVEFSKGDILLFLNNDTEMINSDAIERMVEHIIRKEIGIVGAKLYYPDNTIQHAGVIIIPTTGLPAHIYLKLPRNSWGQWGRLKIIQNYSAVTAACLMIRKEVFEEVKGFDKEYPLAFGDIDFCLKVRKKGYLVLWTPFAEFYHYESKTRGYEDTPEKLQRFTGEIKLFNNIWGHIKDPYFSILTI